MAVALPTLASSLRLGNSFTIHDQERRMVATLEGALRTDANVAQVIYLPSAASRAGNDACGAATGAFE
jgi:hypothetical protein